MDASVFRKPLVSPGDAGHRDVAGVPDGRGSAVDSNAGMDLGPPVSYLAIKEGVSVYDVHRKRIGVVEEVVADLSLDIFDGVIIHTLPLPGRHLFASVDEVAEIRERGVLLAVDRGALRPLDTTTFRRRHKRAQPADGKAKALLRRAWDRITGRRLPHR